MDFTSFSAIATGLIMLFFYVIKSGLKTGTYEKIKGWIPACATVLGIGLGLLWAHQNNLPLLNIGIIYESAKVGLAAIGIDQLVKRTTEKVGVNK